MIIETNKMPCWYYDRRDLRNTFSVRDGLDYETERRYRKEGARFIMQCGTAMSLGHNTIATGVVYFHRFYMFHSFKSFPRYVTACCCLFLAGKVEETPKKCLDVIKTARALLSDNKFESFGEDPKEEVMTLERILLQTIKFDLQIEHPYSFLVKYAKCLKGDKSRLQKMVQMAWNFVNDSLSTTVCLQWEPEIIAVALIHLASKLSKFTVDDWSGRQTSHLRWWDMFVSNVTMEILEDICHQVLDLYQHANQLTAPDSPPQLPPSKASPPVQQKRAHNSQTASNLSNRQYYEQENHHNINSSQRSTSGAGASGVAASASSTITSAQQQHHQQMPITTKITTVDNSKLDNQPIPKLISTNDNIQYTYPEHFPEHDLYFQFGETHRRHAAMYAQPPQMQAYAANPSVPPPSIQHPYAYSQPPPLQPGPPIPPTQYQYYGGPPPGPPRGFNSF